MSIPRFGKVSLRRKFGAGLEGHTRFDASSFLRQTAVDFDTGKRLFADGHAAVAQSGSVFASFAESAGAISLQTCASSIDAHPGTMSVDAETALTKVSERFIGPSGTRTRWKSCPRRFCEVLQVLSITRAGAGVCDELSGSPTPNLKSHTREVRLDRPASHWPGATLSSWKAAGREQQQMADYGHAAKITHASRMGRGPVWLSKNRFVALRSQPSGQQPNTGRHF